MVFVRICIYTYVCTCVKEDRREERPEEDLKASELSPSIVKFSYKFLLDVNSMAAVGAQSQLEGGSWDRAGVVRRGWTKRKERSRARTQLGYFQVSLLTPPTLPSSSFCSFSSSSTIVFISGCLLVLLILQRLTIHAGEKLVLLVFIPFRIRLLFFVNVLSFFKHLTFCSSQ